MHDIRFIRGNPDAFDAALGRRGIDPLAATILDIDTRRRAVQGQLQDLQSRRNVASKEIGARKGRGEDADELIRKSLRSNQTCLNWRQKRVNLLQPPLDAHLMELPNLLDADVPDGANEDENKLLRSIGDIPSFSFTPKDHVALGEGLGQMDFALGAKLAGARFVVLSGQLARLERALAAFMLDTHTARIWLSGNAAALSCE